ncbi:uncharacterized protein LOC129591370 [Paramacrobiotus metropolitanus]|uniref:uncharacterized protein LOC129591370 n=1 Tax=Paramacrobiotus metropolitanus TaxID=2943436 RepID=UPI0024464B60|nr:uncharacterized protein LOC129591370 [Paramacrobiotus metropolitanus]
MDHRHMFSVREPHLNRTLVGTAAFAGAAYMGFRLLKLVNYWNRGEIPELETSDALALTSALSASSTSGSSGFDALDLPYGQHYSSWMSSSATVSPNPTFQRRLKQLSKARGNTSLPSTPRASLFFPMTMPLDVGINALLNGLNSPQEESRSIIHVNSLKFDKQLQAFGLEVMASQTEQSLKSVSNLDAKCLVKLVSTHYAQQDEELFMKLITAIANCSTFTSNQDSLREAGCLEALRDLLKSSAPERIKSVVAQAMSNLAVNEVNQGFLKECVPDLLNALRTAQFEGLQLNCLNALLNLSVLPQNHVYFDEKSVEVLFSKFDVVSQSTDNEKFHALKVLVNLSCSDETVPKLLRTKIPKTFLGLFFNPSVAEPVLLRLSLLLRNVLKQVRSQSAVSGYPQDSLGYLLSSPALLTEIHERSLVLGSNSANAEFRELTGEIYRLTLLRSDPTPT